jgi:Mg-chelatase subunit ChlD
MSKNKIDATSYEIEKGLHLVRQTISKIAPTTPAETPTNHLAILDVSGSMSSDLPKIQAQLKRKLPKLLKDGDTLSMIWFSGKGQFGTLFEAEAVSTLADLNDINKAIDRWLRPVGLTGFKEPLAEAEALIARVKKTNKNPFALFFMSDGHDNQWNRADILKTVEKTAGVLASATFVEYGYYADRPLLAAMAEKAGGTLIFAEAFDKYEPMFEADVRSSNAKAPDGW